MKRGDHRGGLSRRALLRGAGAAIALPALASLPGAAGAVERTAPPKRLSVFYFPNGMRMDNFTPATVGVGFAPSPILRPLEPFRDAYSVVTGLAHYQAQSLGEPGGAHGRSTATYLTGARPKPTEGSDLRCGVSMDQRAAEVIGAQSPFSSLQLGIEPSSLLGSCDIGFSCTYTNTLSWRSPTQALPVMVNPVDVFDLLFADSAHADPAARQAAIARRASILDFVAADAKRLSGRLGGQDRRKVDEYLTSVREVELRVQRLAAQEVSSEAAELALPDGIPEDFAAHVALMVDLQVLALQADLTRVVTFMLGRELSNRAYPEIGVPDSHHSLSHHGGNPDKIAKLVKISTFHMAQLAYLVRRLKETSDGEHGSLLDSTLVFAGASLGEPNDHDCMDLPAILAGGGVRANQHALQSKDTPMSNLLLAVLHQLGVADERFGDSSGAIAGLFA